MAEKELTLFGGSSSWNAKDWITSDDRVRGGKSQSYLECSSSSARFHGELDIKTLGGAGFASQRTAGDDVSWDLSGYDGIQLKLYTSKADNQRYTFIIKDELLPKNPENGREQSTTSWEYDFSNDLKESAGDHSLLLFIPWDSFKPTYRGKEKKDPLPLDHKNIKRFSIMMRSFFGDQEGPFSLSIRSIKAVTTPRDVGKGAYSIEEQDFSPPMHRYSFVIAAALMLLAIPSMLRMSVRK
ncbi:CIA30-domain-containing protein [Mytilinidion resinicola]|uniref:CIA30-domain-containing protein n=1 Tax=Mytilinidion resinicola TaxID=574789 RepID=A0A6A6YWM1_9PEZI|nr:CIA30-domain-containing protein [Mytilinidion resinicola]KAF2813201.1 CIA30-domain-containing protein [Mytilinidion resinicola]